jgi:hypothetical protein
MWQPAHPKTQLIACGSEAKLNSKGTAVLTCALMQHNADVHPRSPIKHALASLVRMASSYRPQPSGKTTSGVARQRRTKDFGRNQWFGTTLDLSASSEASRLNAINKLRFLIFGVRLADLLPRRRLNDSRSCCRRAKRKRTLLRRMLKQAPRPNSSLVWN